MIQLKDVIHYYIGQKCQHEDGETATIIGVDTTNFYTIHDGTGSYGTVDINTTTDKPHLRRITSLTDDEKVKWYDFQLTIHQAPRETKIGYFNNLLMSVPIEQMNFVPASFHYLLSIGVDLFNLIDTNQAIETNPST